MKRSTHHIHYSLNQASGWLHAGIVSAALSVSVSMYAQFPLPDNFNPGASSNVTSLAVQADGKILVGGLFTTLGGQQRNYLGRLNADGTLDSGFNPGANSLVFSLEVQADGKILVGGFFTTLGGQPRNYLARLNADGTLDSGFNPGANSYVYSLAVQADGKIVVSGGFTTLGGQPRNYIGRLNADGTLDSGFNPGASSSVSSLAVQADGKILVGGYFTTLGGQPRNYLARLNANGTLDSGFNPGASSSVSSLAEQADGKILVGGDFTTLGGQTRTNIARLNSDGTLDNTFNPGANGSVWSLAVQADGKILVGGQFTTLGGQARERIARLNSDGTLDNTFNPGAGDSVWCLAVQADGKILVGGGFTTLGGQARMKIARLNNTGPATQSLSYDGSTIIWLRGGSGPEVWRTTFDYSTDVTTWTNLGVGARIAGGWQLGGVFVPPGGWIRARGYASGGQYNGSGWFVESMIGRPLILLQPDNRTNNAGTPAFFSLTAAGTEPLGYQWRKDGMALVDGGSIAGAMMSTLTVSNVLRSDEGGYSVVVTNTEGSVTSVVATLTVIDPAINVQPVSQNREPGESVTFNVTAAGTAPLTYQWWKDAVALGPQGPGAELTLTNLHGTDAGNYTVVVSNQYGSVTSAAALLTVNLATLDAGFNPGVDGVVLSPAVQADGKILVGGHFTTLGGQQRTNLARLNANGTLDNGFNPGPNSTVYSVAVQADGKILVGGAFTTLGGQPRNYIGRVNANGTLDSAFNPGANSYVYSLAVQADGKILVGGLFTTLGGQPRNYLGRLNANGTLDTSFNPGASGGVYSLAVQADGKILVGGSFTTLGGQPRSYIGRLNANGTVDSGFNPGAGGSNPYDTYAVWSLAVQADGKILVGGGFTTLVGQPRNRIGRLNSDGTLDATFNSGANSTVLSLAVQADGKILVGGLLTTLGGQPRNYLGRLNADGTLDSRFNPGANNYVNSLAVQADGKILVGGAFTTLAGQPQGNIGRLNNTEPATQSLAFDGSTITWLRGGTSPEVWRTTFDSPTNGLIWASLGAGTRIPGGWQLGGVSVPPGGVIRARGHVTGGQFNGSGWFVETTIGPPLLMSQPSSRTNDAGTTASFQVSAVGAEPFTFRWRKDGLALPDDGNVSGTSTTTLTVSNVFGGDAGGYSVVVSNAEGSVTSVVATLTVIDPLITGQPADQTRNGGESVTFSVTALGTALDYHWWKDNVALLDGGNITGALTPTLTVSNLLGSDAGGYTVAVSNAFGVASSRLAQLRVITVPEILVQPADQVTFPGGWATFQVEAHGPEPLGYQWQFEGAPIDEATNPVLGLNGVWAFQAGSYSVAVRNGFGTTISSSATLTVVPVAAWGEDWDGQTDVPTSVTNTVAIAAGGGHSLALQSDGSVIAWGRNWDGQTDVPVDLTNAVAIAGGEYHSLALKSDGAVVGWGANWSGQSEPPADLTNVIAVAGGGSHSLALKGDGTVVAWGSQTDVPAEVTNVVAIAAGSERSLAVRSNGTVVAWEYGVSVEVPAGLTNVIAVAAGSYQSLALRRGGTVVAWENSGGQLDVPEQVTNVVAIAAGGQHNLALKNDGTVVAWNNWGGQTVVPTGLANVVAIAAGGQHSLALVGEGPPVHYVSAQSTNSLPPYDSWATAATRIQDAVDVAAVHGAIVLVSNGVYAAGGRAVVGTMTNRVAVNKPLTIRSLNGPQSTLIQGRQVTGTTNGDGAIRCVYLTNGASLSGFTLTNGATRTSGDWAREQTGGGVWCESTNAVVTKCVVTGNSAHGGGGGAYQGMLNNCKLAGNLAQYGGGAFYCMLNNCVLTGNSVRYSGGGAYQGTLETCILIGNWAGLFGGGVTDSTLDNCTLTGNAASEWGGGAYDSALNNCTMTGNSATNSGGGVAFGVLHNCIVFSNTAPDGANYLGSVLNYCCTTPQPESWLGVGNITNAPLFVDYAGGNLRLQSNSPCINAGLNAYAPGPTDLDGLPRIVSGTVDIGVYEFQGPGSVISYAWLQQYGLPTDGSVDFIDSDGEGMNNWQEYLADTSPLDANDYLHITSFTRSGTYNTLWWASKATRLYQVERRESFEAVSLWETIITNAVPGWNNVGFDNTGPQYFYRIRAVRP